MFFEIQCRHRASHGMRENFPRFRATAKNRVTDHFKVFHIVLKSVHMRYRWVRKAFCPSGSSMAALVIRDHTVVMMNKATWGKFKAVQAGGNYGYDPFEGLPVLFNNTIKAYSAASANNTYAIVGDLGHGALANFPDGDGIDFKFDDMTEMTKDLIRVLGRQYVGLGIVAPNAFVKIIK